MVRSSIEAFAIKVTFPRRPGQYTGWKQIEAATSLADILVEFLQ